MKKLVVSILIACVAIAGPFASFPTGALDPLESVSMDEATTVAENWIDLIIEKKGDWGGSWRAAVVNCQALRRGERVLGYFCPVSPRGCIVVSLYKALAPVKFYSTVGSFDPDTDEGVADLLKDVMERVLDALEGQVGPLEAATSQVVEAVLEIDHHDAWDDLLGSQKLDWANYQAGDVLVSSEWHQQPPYNDQCPDMSCTWTCNINANALVGCVCTAGAQIMRYWNWPPFGIGSPYNDAYDWVNMLDMVPCGATTAQIGAVAELCAEGGEAVSMSYGCGGSGSDHPPMMDAYEDDFRYHSNVSRVWRSSYTAVEWFNLMKAQFNLNRPVQYGIPGHSLIADGWEEIGATPTRNMHGWGGTNSGWVAVDGVPGGTIPGDDFIRDIYPAQSLGSSLSGTYSKESFNYRYFDLDATGNATFSAGQFLQFLPGIVVTSSGTVRFYGSGADSTRLFTSGNTTRGIRIYGGAIRLNNNGAIRLP